MGVLSVKCTFYLKMYQNAFEGRALHELDAEHTAPPKTGFDDSRRE